MAAYYFLAKRSQTVIKAVSSSTVLLMGALLLSGALLAQQTTNQWATLPPAAAQKGAIPRAYVVVKPYYPSARPASPASGSATQSGGDWFSHHPSPIGLPFWFYDVPSSRDGNLYYGMMVGKNPYSEGGTVKVPTFIVPVIITTNTVGVTADVTNTGTITTAPGINTFDPTTADKTCMTAPNNVPATVFRQSPIFENARFNFGGNYIGNTQYLDAFQRANFWRVIDDDYHVLLNPITTLPPLVLNVPAQYGTTFPTSILKNPICGQEAIVDINWFDSYISNTYIPALAASGVNSGTLPIFQFYNVSLAVTPATNIFDCCILGYHGANYYTPVQTYSVADFDTTGLFGPGAEDTAVLAHEIGEWMNDPIGFNPTPLWGNTGQVQGSCQNNLEVGDPLTGTLMPLVKMPNGFSYHLQELAFYSWFLGKPSIGVNGWYSSNGTFLTDAGPPCQ